MICLGRQPATTTKGYDSSVAQLRAYELFRANFMARHPGGLVLSELDYKGATTIALEGYHSIRVANQQHSIILNALGTDFRRWRKEKDFRKPDGLAINAQGTVVELMEVTTATNRHRAQTQMRDKINTLEGINRIHNLRVHWKPTDWKPAQTERELYYVAKPQPGELLRYVCFKPTHRETAQPGIILYEMHVISRNALRSVPTSVPQSIQEPLRTAYQRRRAGLMSATAWAEGVLMAHPLLKPTLQSLALTMGVGLTVAAVLLVFTPVPGDEVAAAYAAMALIRLANIK